MSGSNNKFSSSEVLYMPVAGVKAPARDTEQGDAVVLGQQQWRAAAGETSTSGASISGASTSGEKSESAERKASHEKIAAALSRSRANNGHSALLLYRICGYRELVETFGEDIGEQVIHDTQECLRKCLRSDDSLHQVSVDEFAIVPDRPPCSSDYQHLAVRLLESDGDSSAVAKLSPWINAAVGVAINDTSSYHLDELLRMARMALYRAADSDKFRYAVYDRAMSKKHHQRLWLEQELEQALAQGRYRLHYQPQYALGSTEIVSLEALVRLETTDGELLQPDEFIQVAEDNGMIIPIGCWVIRQACEQLARWRAAGYSIQRIAVNVSPRQFENHLLLQEVENAITSNGLCYSDLELELTEHCLLEYTPRIENDFRELRERGVRIALDDFGTGYSSFASLVKQPLDVLKLDRSFMTDVDTDPRSQRVVRTLIAMARELGLDMVAEGIETSDQWQFLVDSGCTMAQGFGLARPDRPEVIAQLLQPADDLARQSQAG